jgi:hypothetical protein
MPLLIPLPLLPLRIERHPLVEIVTSMAPSAADSAKCMHTRLLH